MTAHREKRLKKVIDMAGRDPSILAVFLFGSTARGERDAFSDTDVCLVMSHRPRTARALSSKRLEYLAALDLDFAVFQQLPIYVRARVLKEGRLLYSRDDAALYELAFKTIQEFADFEHIYRECLNEVAGAG